MKNFFYPERQPIENTRNKLYDVDDNRNSIPHVTPKIFHYFKNEQERKIGLPSEP